MQDLVHAYADGELDLAHTLEVERHLLDCPACARTCAEVRSLSAALRAGLPRFEPPPGLRARLRARAPKRRRLVLAAALVLLAAGLGGLASLRAGSSAHVRLVH
jgi:anti-sigma factor RsiW